MTVMELGPGVRLESMLPEIIGAAEVESPAAVEKAIHAIEAGAVMRSRVDTGQMRDGWQAYMTGPAEGIVENNVEHVIYNEFGTINMTAQPMLNPSIEEVRPGFVNEIVAIYTVQGGGFARAML